MQFFLLRADGVVGDDSCLEYQCPALLGGSAQAQSFFSFWEASSVSTL
jgi:hypothetical protein